jgi:hypothetical protein
MPFSTTLANAILTDLLIDGDYYADLYLGLSTADPGNDGSGASEPSGSAYARVQVTPGSTNWNTPATRQCSNKINMDFPEATGSWGTCTHLLIYDASTGGNFVLGALLANLSDAEIGLYNETTVSGTIDDTSNPIAPNTDETKSDVFLITFLTATTYKVVGASLGDLGDGVIGADQIYHDPDDGEELFTIPSAFWGGTWAQDETVQFVLTAAVSGSMQVESGYKPRFKAGELIIGL